MAKYISGKIDVNVDMKGYSLTTSYLEKWTEILSEYSASTTKGMLEMALTAKVETIKKAGKIANDSYVTLEEEMNGVKSFKIPDHVKRTFKIGDKVVVTFAEKKVKDIQLTADYINENIVDKVEKPKKSNQPKEKLIPEHGFYVTPAQEKVLKITNQEVMKDKENVILSLVGAAGYGKTSIAQYYAWKYNQPILVIDCSTIADNQEWYVNPEFKNGETNYQITELVKFLANGFCTIVFDEINRMPSWLSNVLLPILDHRKETRVREISVKAKNGITFFFTSNQGAEYTGTNPLDKALLGRVMGSLLVNVLPEDVEIELLQMRHGVKESDSEKIVQLMTRLRESVVKSYPVNLSTRSSLYLAFWVNAGLTLREAVEIVIENVTPYEVRKAIYEALNLVGEKV